MSIWNCVALKRLIQHGVCRSKLCCLNFEETFNVSMLLQSLLVPFFETCLINLNMFWTQDKTCLSVTCFHMKHVTDETCFKRFKTCLKRNKAHGAPAHLEYAKYIQLSTGEMPSPRASKSDEKWQTTQFDLEPDIQYLN